MTTYILAVDPGETTGLAFYDLVSGSFVSYEASFNDTCRALLTGGSQYGAELNIVAEAFIINRKTAEKTFQPWSLELIGVCRLASRLYTGKELTLQGADPAKRMATNARLAHLGWRRPSEGGHADDAARHLLLYCVSHKLLPENILSQLVDI